ncbi:MAG: hypothetical protein FJW39_35165 [Acidobacteria bacterium]|nr:hypothetical protein [Acidobacteriota bacterium]
MTATPMAILLGVVGVPTETRADPPSWAPAHGWRRKTGNESGFTGKKNKTDNVQNLSHFREWWLLLE